MAVVKLRKEDQKTLDRLQSTIRGMKMGTSKSEVLGLSLRFAHSKLDEFVATVIEDLERESVIDLLRNPREGEKTDARRVEEYLYG